ncbi:SDR family NAD(P)-dependent oxidoreductase [Pseudooceanicola sp.]|uniref:SDR family NAD(P)-dependent oxidoreductase n=1 Tax=Pseudooceanicola sp. TaxID=1914328 RepID=UPI00351430D4
MSKRQGLGLGGKVALVTGGATGIGAAIARRFHAEGAVTCVTDVNESAAEALVTALNEEANGSVSASSMRLDVTRSADWAAVLDQLRAVHGGVDILVNNAGILDMAPLEDITDASWDQTMAINAKGPFLGTRAVMAVMRARGGGAIVNVSSMAGISGGRAAHYVSSKGAVRLLTKSAALIGAPDNIRCNSVHPGMVETEMARAAVARPGAREERLARLPLGRFADPSEIASVVAFLASDEASFMTGAEICVDGGAVLT